SPAWSCSRCSSSRSTPSSRWSSGGCWCGAPQRSRRADKPVLRVPPPPPTPLAIGFLPPPFRRIDEGAGPDAALVRFRLCLLGHVDPAESRCDGPTLPHQPGVDVAAVGQRADRDCAPVAVTRAWPAGQLASANMVAQLVTGGEAAAPGPPMGIG